MDAVSPAAPLDLRVAAVSAEARDVMMLELAAADGGRLPPLDPGGHVELVLPNGLVRHYSLVNDGRDADRYLLAVGLAAESRGGSAYIHGSLRSGDRLTATGLRNNFPLDEAAAAYRFIAGGIGITPIMPMIRWCRRNGRPWRLAYAARSRQRAAFYEDLSALGAEGRTDFHFDDEAGRTLDLGAALDGLAAGEQVYCCGPAGLMAAVAAATAGLPDGRVHFEWFTAAGSASPPAGATAFTVELRRSGRLLPVPADRSILEVLEANGIAVPYGCREGLCRTCETPVCAGEVEHRDHVLSAAERQAGSTMMLCVSRARGERLVLDL